MGDLGAQWLQKEIIHTHTPTQIIHTPTPAWKKKNKKIKKIKKQGSWCSLGALCLQLKHIHTHTYTHPHPQKKKKKKKKKNPPSFRVMVQFGYLMPAVEPLLYGCPSHNFVSIFASFQSLRLWTERRPASVDSSLVVKANCEAALMYTWYYFRAME